MKSVKAISFLILLSTLLGLALASGGCEYQTKTERRVAFFYKSEDGGNVTKSRDIGSFTQNRHKGNKVDRFFYRIKDMSK